MYDHIIVATKKRNENIEKILFKNCKLGALIFIDMVYMEFSSARPKVSLFCTVKRKSKRELFVHLIYYILRKTHDKIPGSIYLVKT